MKEEFAGSRRLESRFAFPKNLVGLERILPYALLLSITFALYGPTLYYNFVWDDFGYVRGNYRIQGLDFARLREIWTTPYLFNYAPLHNTLLAILFHFSGLEPFAYHAAQLGLHCACICMLYFVLEELESRPVALLTTLLFAVHPANVETVAWVSETKSTLAFLFFLASFHYFIRLRKREHWEDLLLTGLFLVLSLLSKINTVVAPVIFILYDYKRDSLRRGKRAWELVCFFLISLIFTAIHLRSSTTNSFAAPELLVDATLPDSTLPPPSALSGYYGGFHVHLLNMSGLILHYAGMIFFPYPLASWQMVRVYGAPTWPVILAWGAVLGAGLVLYRSQRDTQFWALWFLIFLLPVLQLVPNPIWVANRYLYLPAIGVFVLCSRLFCSVSGRIKGLRSRLLWDLAMLSILIALSGETLRYVPVWRSDLALWEDTVQKCDTSAFCHYRLGQALLESDRDRKAIEEFTRAVQIRPAPDYLIQLGDAYADHIGDYGKAIQTFRAAQKLSPILPFGLLVGAAKAHYLAGEYDQTRALLDFGLKLRPRNSGLLLVDGFLKWKQGKAQSARDSLKRVLAINAENPASAHPARFLISKWEHPAEVGQLMHDVGNF